MTTKEQYDRAYLRGHSAGTVGKRESANPHTGPGGDPILAERWEHGRSAAADKRGAKNG